MLRFRSIAVSIKLLVFDGPDEAEGKIPIVTSAVIARKYLSNTSLAIVHQANLLVDGILPALLRCN